MATVKVVDARQGSTSIGLRIDFDPAAALYSAPSVALIELASRAGLALFMDASGVKIGGAIKASGKGQYGVIVHRNLSSGPVYMMRAKLMTDDALALAREHDTDDARSDVAQSATGCHCVKACDASMAAAAIDPMVARRVALAWVRLVARFGAGCNVCDPRVDARRMLVLAECEDRDTAAAIAAAASTEDPIGEPAALAIEEPAAPAPVKRNRKGKGKPAADRQS